MLRNRDPIPELENLIAYGVKEARDDDLAIRFGQLRVEISKPYTADLANWLGIYRNALKLADLIRPIRTQEQSVTLLSSEDITLVNRNLLEICTNARTVCQRWSQRLEGESLINMRTKLRQKIDVLDFEMTSIDGHLCASLPMDIQRELLSWMNERAQVFISHYFESLELQLAQTYREGLNPVRRKVAQFALRRPRIIRSKPFEFCFLELPAMEANAIALPPSSLKERFLERRNKREKSDAIRQACKQKLYEYIEGELSRLRKEVEICLSQFEETLTTMLDDWLLAAQIRLESITDEAERNRRPLTVGRRLEKDIIPALIERIEYLEH